MYGKYALINNDLYDIAKRLREIDRDYFVVYNYRRARFEVHCSGQKGGTLAVTVPYDRLDARTVSLVLRTRIERRDRLIRELEEDNLRLEKAENTRVMKKAELIAEEQMSIAGS